MKRWINKDCVQSLGIAGGLAVESLLMIDAVIVCFGGFTPPAPAAGLLVFLMLLFFVLSRRKKKQMAAAAVGIPVVLGMVIVLGFACWKQFSSNAVYSVPDSGKNGIYGNRRVMVIVPHQDDELNILGGVLEEYVRYGSELYPVFITNGDYYQTADVRYQEALAVLDRIGVPEDHAVFLGYGDNWKEGGPHIYNAAPGAVAESRAGRKKTYGAEEHPAYREGRAYTIDNLTEDLKDVIQENMPDVIFCSDYDHHVDHKATTLLFDKVMGQILKEDPEYTPVVYKAYAYGTAWEAEKDYYRNNILSTKNPFGEPYGQRPAVYRWEDRVRFPVQGEGLSRSLMSAEGYALLSLHESQGAKLEAASVINGDKVAWQRYTDSLCLHAEITSTSGRAELLNDFMLIENDCLVDEHHQPYDGVWIPDQEDADKTVTVRLKEPADISAIVLYDHPSEEHNVRNVVITFDDGTAMETGPLDAGGAATSISVEKKNVTGFTVMLTETEGDQAGLTEIETFAQIPCREGRFLKLMDGDGNFAYDYRTGRDGYAEFRIYTHGDLPDVTSEHYAINTTGERGTASLEDGVIRVDCPAGEHMVLNVTCNAAGVSDSITIRNPGVLERGWTDLWQHMEEAVFSGYCKNLQGKLLIPSTLEKISYVIRHMGE